MFELELLVRGQQMTLLPATLGHDRHDAYGLGSVKSFTASSLMVRSHTSDRRRMRGCYFIRSTGRCSRVRCYAWPPFFRCHQCHFIRKTGRCFRYAPPGSLVALYHDIPLALCSILHTKDLLQYRQKAGSRVRSIDRIQIST